MDIIDIIDLIHLLLLCAENLGMLEKVGRYIKYMNKSIMMNDVRITNQRNKECICVGIAVLNLKKDCVYVGMAVKSREKRTVLYG